jgi:hypothetical protein
VGLISQQSDPGSESCETAAGRKSGADLGSIRFVGLFEGPLFITFGRRGLKITQAQNKAAGELVELIAAVIGKNRAIHPQTAISSAARLSGSLLLRSFNLNLDTLEPGTILLSPAADEKFPMLINTLAAFLSRSNVQLDQQKLGAQQASRGEAPHLDTLGALSRLQEPAIAIGKDNHLSLEQTAQAAALATGFIVKECAPQIGAETGFNISALGFVEGSKTVPPRTGGSPPVAPNTKRWYKFW